MPTVTRRRLGRRLRLTAVLGAIAFVASSCFYLPNAVNHENTSPDTRPWWCHSTGDGGHHVEPAYHGQTKGMLTWDDCKAVSAQFDLALDYAMQWPTRGDAEAAGAHGLVNYVEGMGTHHAFMGDFTGDDLLDPSFDPLNPEFPGSPLDGAFDPTRPEFLQYDGNGPDAELVGMSWYVKVDPTNPPPGFRGDNDWWHRHQLLCFNTTNFRVVGEDITDATCASRGGINLHLGSYWMVHAWIVDGWQHEPDVFVNHHPCLPLAGGPATHDDPCWDSHGGHMPHAPLG